MGNGSVNEKKTEFADHFVVVLTEMQGWQSGNFSVWSFR